MEDPLYREIILEHWQNPQNYGVIEAATMQADGKNPLCGDEIHLTGVVENGVLVDVAFTGEGCAISKASASLFTERVKGMTIQDIEKLTAEDVLKGLEISIAPARIKCALLVYSTLKSAMAQT